MKAEKENSGKELAGARMLHQEGSPLRKNCSLLHLSSQSLSFVFRKYYSKNKQLSVKPLVFIFKFFILGRQSRVGGNTFKNNKTTT